MDEADLETSSLSEGSSQSGDFKEDISNAEEESALLTKSQGKPSKKTALSRRVQAKTEEQTESQSSSHIPAPIVTPRPNTPQPTPISKEIEDIFNSS